MRLDKEMVRKILIILGIIFVIGILVLVVYYFINMDSINGVVKGDNHEEFADIEQQEAIAIYNQSFVDKNVGRERSVPMYRCLQDFFLKDSEKKTATHKNNSPENADNYYGATIMTDTITAPVMTPEEWTYKVNISISDGRMYDWYYRIDTDFEYAYSIIHNPSNNSYHYCPSDKMNIPLDEVKMWLQNSLGITPEVIDDFPEK